MRSSPAHSRGLSRALLAALLIVLTQIPPAAAREGDVLRCVPRDDAAGSRSVSFALDSAARAEQLSRARELRGRLPRGPKGDVSL